MERPFERHLYAALSLVASLIGPAGIAGCNTESVAQKIAELREDDDVSTLEFSPDGGRLAVGTFTTLHVHLWAWRDRQYIDHTLLKPSRLLKFLVIERL